MYIIIGQGAAGTTAANELRRIDSRTPITILTNETDHFYSRIDLPDIIAGKRSAVSSVLQSAEQFAESDIQCKMGVRVNSIDPLEKRVELSSGEKLSYTKLLLATGSSPVIPPMEGVKAQGVYTLWTMNQAEAISQAATDVKAAVVIGAGLIGIKTALALAARGLDVTVVEKMPRLLPRQLDATASEMIADKVRRKGVQVAVNSSVERIEHAAGAVCGVTVSGRTIACDIVLMSVGVRPNTDLAHAAGIHVRRGIIVDEYMQTSANDIYAAGDVAEVIDLLTGDTTVPAIWPEAVQQGIIAAHNMANQRKLYTAGTALNSVEIAGVPIVSIGDIEGNPDDEVFEFRKGAIYRKVIIRGGILRGALCIGDIRRAGVLANMVLTQREIDLPSSWIADPSFSFADLMAI